MKYVISIATLKICLVLKYHNVYDQSNVNPKTCQFDILIKANQ